MPAYRSKNKGRKQPLNEIPARLDFEHVTVSYNGKPALDDLTFLIPHGERVAVVGPNGAGKSTLFKALVGLLPVQKGRILIHGQHLGHHHECVAYVPQKEEVDWRFPLNVEDVVMMGRFGQLGWLKRPTLEDRKAVKRSLEQMGIADLASHPISELSGGQQQRVFLARALAQEPHILLMDEPFNGVDAATQETVLQLLEQLEGEDVTTLVSTHDLSLAATRFNRVLLLNKRLISYGKPEEAFQTETLKQAFGGQVFRLSDGTTVVDECCPPGEDTVIIGEHHIHVKDNKE